MPKPKKKESKQDFLSRCTKELIDKEGQESDQAYAMCNAFWDDANDQRSTLTLSAPLELKKGDDGDVKSFMITAYTGKPIKTWFGPIIFDIAGMTAKAKIPVLREHRRDRIVGIGDKSWSDKNHFFVSGDFVASTRDGREVLDLGKEGYPWQASVSIWPEKIKVLDSDKQSETVNGQEIKGPAEIWLESMVGEVSFVSLGADDDTAAIVLSDQKVPVSIDRIKTKTKEEKMEITLEMLKDVAPELLARIQEEARKDGHEAGLTEGRKEGKDAERTRVVEVLGAGADFEVAKKAIEDGISAEGAYKLFYEAEKKKGAAALDELEIEAAESLGQETPETETSADPETDLMTRAKKLALEKKISVGAAMREIQARDPDAVKAALPVLQVVN